MLSAGAATGWGAAAELLLDTGEAERYVEAGSAACALGVAVRDDEPGVAAGTLGMSSGAGTCTAPPGGGDTRACAVAPACIWCRGTLTRMMVGSVPGDTMSVERGDVLTMDLKGNTASSKYACRDVMTGLVSRL